MAGHPCDSDIQWILTLTSGHSGDSDNDMTGHPGGSDNDMTGYPLYSDNDMTDQPGYSDNVMTDDTMIRLATHVILTSSGF